MARRSRRKQILSAASELRKGFTVPTHSKIRSILNRKSKTFVISLFLSAFSMLPKGKKLKLLVKIEKGISRIKRRTRRKTRGRRRGRGRRRKATTRRRRRGRASRRRSGKGRTAKQRAATRKLVAFNKRRRR